MTEEYPLTRAPYARSGVEERRLVYDLISEVRVLHVLGIVHRGGLERWLGSR